MLTVDVAKSLGGVALAARFEAEPGRVTALFGRSGSGKTSTVNMVAGLLRPDSGRIVLDGETLFDAGRRIDRPPETRRIGYVFQDSRLFPHLSVQRNLRYGEWRTPARRRYVRFDAVVEMLDIGRLLDRRPGDLSGGERQRVAIGRALLTSPRLLLLDEPLAALDAGLKAEILPYLERLRDEVRLPILYVSHAIDEVVRLAAHMVVLSAGAVAATGPVDALMGRLDLRPLTGRYEAGSVIGGAVDATDPATGLTAIALIDAAGRRCGRLLTPDLGLPPGERVRMRVRARDVSLALTPPQDISILNVLPARVVALSAERGPIVDVALVIGEAATAGTVMPGAGEPGAGEPGAGEPGAGEDGAMLSARVTRASADRLGLAPGRLVQALIKGIALDRHSLGLPSRDRVGPRSGHGPDATSQAR